jgi:hypothetical protein
MVRTIRTQMLPLRTLILELILLRRVTLLRILAILDNGLPSIGPESSRMEESSLTLELRILKEELALLMLEVLICLSAGSLPSNNFTQEPRLRSTAQLTKFGDQLLSKLQLEMVTSQRIPILTLTSKLLTAMWPHKERTQPRTCSQRQQLCSQILAFTYI